MTRSATRPTAALTRPRIRRAWHRLPLAACALLLAACAQRPPSPPAPQPPAPPGSPTPPATPRAPAANDFSPAALQALRPAQFRSTVGSEAQARERLEQERTRLLAAVAAALRAPQDPAALRELAQGLNTAAHYNVEIATARPALLAALPTLDRQPADLQRPLLSAAYTLYPAESAPALRELLPRLATPREFAIAAYTLMQSRQPADLALVRSQLQARLATPPGAAPARLAGSAAPAPDPRLIALDQALSLAEGHPAPPRPPLAELFTARPGHPVVFSLQRPGRQQMGLALVRQADGRFVRRPDGGLFHIGQLALSRSNLPGTITLGNTPQGLFSIQGAGRAASNIWIGPTPYLHSKVPIEASVAEFEQRERGPSEPGWTEARYRALLPGAWARYAPLQEAWLAGLAGRDEMLSHGSTIDPRYYLGASYFPGTPSAGCLVAMEYWSPEGRLVHSDQLALLQAFSHQGRDRGYLVLVELDAGPGPVSLAEVIGAIQQAETALAR